MVILGINAYHADASAAILVDGQLVAAAEEERFNRIKHSAGFPERAVRYCLDAAGIDVQEIDHVAIPRDPRARIWKKLLYACRMPRLAWDRLHAQAKCASVGEMLAGAFDGGSHLRAHVHRVEHHKAHLASAFLVSPFDDATLLSIDGLGDFASTMWGTGRGGNMIIDGAVEFPHSLGIYYTALTQYLGFWNYGDEYKVMGLGAYGEPEYCDRFEELVNVDGSLGFKLALDCFTHHKSGPEMSWEEGAPVVERLYSDRLVDWLGPARNPAEPIDRRHRNIAASAQQRLEVVLLSLLQRLYQIHPNKNLCLAGGVAFNCAANGRIVAESPFESIYIQPAAGDAGLAIGAAFYVWHQLLGKPRMFAMKHAYLGPEFSDADIRNALEREGAAMRGSRVVKLPEDELLRLTARKIAQGKIVGWFQGRMEWGPRALGNRSIVADPRRPEMKDLLNRRIKHREAFRPFAPSILKERVDDWFEETHPSPFMQMACKVRQEKRAIIPAPTHIDGTARLQTVSRDENPRYWKLISEFEKLTGVPVVLNTSFNDNEPIVCTPEQALHCFGSTQMDVLTIGPYVVEKIPVRGQRSDIEDPICAAVRPLTADL